VPTKKRSLGELKTRESRDQGGRIVSFKPRSSIDLFLLQEQKRNQSEGGWDQAYTKRGEKQEEFGIGGGLPEALTGKEAGKTSQNCTESKKFEEVSLTGASRQ